MLQTQLPLVTDCQRWNNRRASYRPAGELFDPRRAAVEPIEESAAKAFTLKHHYSASYPAARFRAGLFVKQPFQRAQLCGVGVFSVPMNQNVIPHYFSGLAPNEGVEIGRFCLLDSVAANGESWALARMKRLLRTALPAVRAVIAYCDPLERRDVDGTLTKRGHVGTIYKATNSTYRGRSSARTLCWHPRGSAWPTACSPRSGWTKSAKGMPWTDYAPLARRAPASPRAVPTTSAASKSVDGFAHYAIRAIWRSPGRCEPPIMNNDRRPVASFGLWICAEPNRRAEGGATPSNLEGTG